MARSPILSLDPNLDLQSAIAQIAGQEQNQIQGVQKFGAAQDTNIKNIYGQLQGDLTKGVGTVQSIYGNAANNVSASYDRAQLGGQAAASQNQGAIGSFASQLGMDPRALAEVQGKLATQAQNFDLRNKQAQAGRVSNLQTLGAGMASVAQLGVQAAQQAEAQGRADLSRKIMSELQRVATSAAEARTSFTQIKATQAQRAAMQAQTEILRAQKELASEQRAAARAMSSGRGGGGGSRTDPFALAEFKAQLGADEYDRRNPTQADPLSEIAKQLGLGTNATTAGQALLSGMTLVDAKKQFKTPGGKQLDWGRIGDVVKNYV